MLKKQLLHLFIGHTYYEFMSVQHGSFVNGKKSTSGNCQIFICECGKVHGKLNLFPQRKFERRSAFGLPIEHIKE